MATFFRTTIIIFTLIFSGSIAHAGLFDDTEARRAILDMRNKIDALNTQLESKADKTSSLNLADQNENLHQEIAVLRGKIEVLANELSTIQQQQKDLYGALDLRLRKLEPQKINIDGQDVSAKENEQQAYDAAIAAFKAEHYNDALAGFSNFLRANPGSGLVPSVQYWLGNTYYALKKYKDAISSQQTLLKQYADYPRNPDALLNIASSYAALKNQAEAKKTLEQLLNQYPNTPAAQTAKERLASLK